MKKVLSLILVFSLLICSFACAEDLLDKIKARGTIIVAMEGCWAPWTYHDDRNDDILTGFDVEVANAIAAKLGVTVKFEECPWDSIFGGIDAGRYDIAVNGVDYTEERAENFRLTEPYTFNRTVLIVRGDNTEITCFEDLKGKKTANTISSTYAALTESYGATTTAVDDLEQTIELVLMGRVDATANAEVSYFDYLTAHPDADIKVVDKTEEADNVVIAMRLDDDTVTLCDAISAAIAELREEGVLGELAIKYFGSDTTVVPGSEE